MGFWHSLSRLSGSDTGHNWGRHTSRTWYKRDR